MVKYDYFKKINSKYNISHLDLFFNISEDTVCFIKDNKIVYAANNSEQKYSLLLKDFNQINGNFTDALVFGKNVYLIRKNCLYELLGKNKLELKAELSKENLVTATRVKNENEWLLFYEKDGLFYYNTLTNKTLKIDFFKYKEIRKIEFDETINRYWIFTYGFGIYLMDEKFNFIPFFKDDKGYLFFAHYFLKDKRGNYWIPTNNGLFKFDAFEIKKYIGNSKTKLKYDYYSKEDGIINNEFNGGNFNSGIKLSNGDLAFSNMEGIVVLKSIDNVPKELDYPVLIDKIVHNNKSIDIKDQYTFEEGSGSFEIFLSTTNYENNYTAPIEFNIPEIVSGWQPLENNRLNLLSLKQGEYNILFRKTGDNNPQKVKRILFSITPPWYYSNRAFLFYFLIMIVFGIVLGRLYYLKKISNTRLEMKQLETELKVLRSQINPHYLSNSLMSLQGMILENEKERAFELVGQYGKVMRSLLETSEYGFLPIQKELSHIEEYIKLESLLQNIPIEFKHTFKSNISNSIIYSIYIPSMILQPIIENAILHGLLPSKKQSHSIQIDISFFNGKLTIIVTDNGVGINKEKVTGSKKSFALANIENRLQVCARLTNQKYLLKIDPVFDENKNKTGTSVFVEFPFKLMDLNKS